MPHKQVHGLALVRRASVRPVLKGVVGLVALLSWSPASDSGAEPELQRPDRMSSVAGPDQEQEPGTPAQPLPEQAPGAQEPVSDTDAPQETASSDMPRLDEPDGEVKQPEPQPARVIQATDDEKAPPPPRRSSVNEAPPAFVRKGLLLDVGGGVTTCAQPPCATIPIGGGGWVQIGYRAGLFGVAATIEGGGGRGEAPNFDTETEARLDGQLSILFVGAGPRLYPVRTGRVDPWLGLSVGYSRVGTSRTEDGEEYRATYSRGGVQFSGGLAVYVLSWMKVGGRLAYTLPFAGTACWDPPLDGDDCVPIADLVRDPDAGNQRFFRRELARPFSALLTLGFVIGRSGQER